MSRSPVPPIDDLALIGDGRSAALVSGAGTIEWCCLPRFDSGSCFGRLLDAERGGACSVEPCDGDDLVRAGSYLERALVHVTTLRGAHGEARLLTFFDGASDHGARIVRVLEGVRGELACDVRVAARFDYGAVRPWVRALDERTSAAIGGNDGLVIATDGELRTDGDHDAVARLRVGEGDRARLALTYLPPHEVEDGWGPLDPREVDDALEATVARWRAWADRCGDHDEETVRSALVLRALVYEPTGAIVAAPTTSLPEAPGGERNWDYRFSWIRDSSFTARVLGRVGHEAAAGGFARFVLRSAAGHADELQVCFGVGGERRLGESELDLAGYRGARPVRIGNGAADQTQLDLYGELLAMTWSWHELGFAPDEDEWRFLVDVVEAAAARWREPDRGFWEWRPGDLHFVHSKASCWGALDRGLRLAASLGREVPAERWRACRDEIRASFDEHAFDERRGCFRQAFGEDGLDACALLLPVVGIVDWRDERMLGTVDVLREDLDDHGLLRRYDGDDGVSGREGAFVACTFWLAECLARQGRGDEARRAYDRAMRAATPLGLLAEEADAATDSALGNFPQGLSHLAQIAAALALRDAAAA